MPIKEKAVELFFQELKKDGNLTADEEKFIDSLLQKEEVASVIKRGVSAQKKFKEEMDKVAADRANYEKEYNKKVSELDSLRTTLAATSSTEVKEREILKATIADREAKLKTIAGRISQYNEGEQILREVGLNDFNFAPVVPSTTPPDVKTSVSKESILEEITPQFQEAQRALARLPFDLAQMQYEYQFLTGKPLDVEEFYNAISKDGTGDYKKVFNSHYNIESLRQEKQEREIAERINKGIKEGIDMELSKRLTPTQTFSHKKSDFFQAIENSIPESEKRDTQSPIGLNNRSAIVAEALADFAKNTA